MKTHDTLMEKGILFNDSYELMLEKKDAEISELKLNVKS